jgi:L-asparaginase
LGLASVLQVFLGKNLVKIVVLGTGGTIAGVSPDPAQDHSYTAAQRPVDDLLQGVALPEDCEVVTEQVAQLDSKDMDHATWRQLLARCRHWLAQDVAGVVITHGTDTLEETAFFLSQTLTAAKPVVLTCAMRPATSRQADGPQNLSDALSLVTQPQARSVLVVCAGEAHAALTVQKVHASRLNAFASPSGPMAVRENGAWIWALNQPLSHDAHEEDAIEKRALACLTHDTWPRVELVMSHAGATGAVVDAMLNASGAPPLAGLVVAATGNLTVHASLQAALDRARAKGVAVLLATRCVWGGVVQTTVEDFDNVFNDVSPLKARIALLLQCLLSQDGAPQRGH